MIYPRFELHPKRSARRLGVFKLSDRERQESQEESRKWREYVAPGVKKEVWERELREGDPTKAMARLSIGRMSTGLPPMEVFPITAEV